jgi:hypothetical protein
MNLNSSMIGWDWDWGWNAEWIRAVSLFPLRPHLDSQCPSYSRKQHGTELTETETSVYVPRSIAERMDALESLPCERID